MDAIALFNYARRFADRAEASGQGTQFPTVRQAAKRFKCRQAEIARAVEETDARREIEGAEYFGLAVGFATGGGHASIDNPADYEIEAYRTPGADQHE